MINSEKGEKKVNIEVPYNKEDALKDLRFIAGNVQDFYDKLPNPVQADLVRLYNGFVIKYFQIENRVENGELNPSEIDELKVQAEKIIKAIGINSREIYGHNKIQ